MIFTCILESSLFAKLDEEGDRVRNSWNLKILKILLPKEYSALELEYI